MKQEILNRYKITTLQRFLMAFDFLMRKNYKLGLFFKNQRLFVSQASEPSDVYWNNLHLQDKERYFRKFLGYVFTTFLLFLCATMIYYMLIKQNDLKNESKSNSGDQNQFTEINVLTYLLAFAIVVVNKILGYVIPLIAG